MQKKYFLAIAVLGLVAAGCNNTTTNQNTSGISTNTTTNVAQTNDSQTNSPATAAAKTFNVAGNNFKFNPSEIRVKKGDTVTINFTNTGGLHDWVIDEFNTRTKQLSGNQSETVTFVADKAGTFEYYCSVGTHRQMGMKGSLIVE